MPRGGLAVAIAPNASRTRFPAPSLLRPMFLLQILDKAGVTFYFRSYKADTPHASGDRGRRGRYEADQDGRRNALERRGLWRALRRGATFVGTASGDRRAGNFFPAGSARNPLISPEFAEIFCNFWKRKETFGSLFGKKLKPLEGK